MDAIKNSTEVLCDQSARRVVGVGPHFVVKYGLQVDLEEGWNMMFFKNTTSVVVPKVYALFQDAQSSQNYIVRERINGIKATLTELRKLPSPDGYCSLGCQPLRDHVFCTGQEEESLRLEGPYKTETELNGGLVKKYLASGDLPVGKAEYYRRAFPSVLTGHPPTFTHGDVQRKNVLVNLTKEDCRITIIDWEFAGWYPSYWEYSRAIFACGHFDDDWNEWVDFILDPYRNE
ncbi:hypothetical protein LTS17_007394 [Exophiala oligosperma]